MTIGDKELIQKFIEASSVFKSAVAEQNLHTSKETYKQMYEIYHKINESSLEQIHKEVAYQQIVQAYHLIQDLKNDTTSPTNIIAIAVVIIILSMIIFINPRMVGLAVFQEKIVQPVNLEWSQNGVQNIELQAVPSSLSVTGELNGEGSARLFAEVDGRRILVFDSANLKSKVFKDVCADSCVMPKINTKKLALSAEVNNAVIVLKSVGYYARNRNHAPVWDGEPKTIAITGETNVDFSQHFSDADGDNLVYMAIVPEGIKASVSGSIVTIIPDSSFKGQTYLELIVSDLKESTRAKIVIDMQ